MSLTEEMIVTYGELKVERDSGKLRGPNGRDLYNALQRVVGWALGFGYDPMDLAGRFIDQHAAIIDDHGTAEGMAVDAITKIKDGKLNPWHASASYHDGMPIFDELFRLFPRSMKQRRLAYTITQLAPVAHERSGDVELDPGFVVLPTRQVAEWGFYFKGTGEPDHGEGRLALQVLDYRGFIRLISKGQPRQNGQAGRPGIYELTFSASDMTAAEDIDRW